MDPDEKVNKGDFPNTRWTMVCRATGPDQEASFQALSELCEEYWYPLYAFVRSQGAPPEDAADEVQGFFATVLQKDFFGSADSNKGKLRTFLIQGIKRYRIDEYRARQTQKRGGKEQHLSIDQEWAEGRFVAEPVDELTPEQILDRSWAKLLLDQVSTELRQTFVAKGKEVEYDTLSPFLAWNSGEETYSETAGKLGISVGNLKVRIHRLRAKYRQILENRISQTLDTCGKEDVLDEMKHLLAALG